MAAVLVERDRQLGALAELLQGCLRGVGCVALIRGPVAVGKTALLHRFAELATHAGVRFLGAAGSPAERHLPFGLLNQLRRGADGGGDRLGAAIEACSDAGGEPGPQAMENVSRAVLDLAAKPLLIGIDDVCHADPESLESLLFVARRVRRTPLMLVLNDQVHAGSGLRRERTELSRQPYCTQIRLHPLSSDGAAALLAQELDAHVAHSLATAVLDATGGNPLLVQALAEDWQQAMREERHTTSAGLVVGDCFAERLMSCLYRCEPEVLAVAAAIAVAGDANEPALGAALAGTGVPEFRAIAELLTDAGVLRHGCYRHPRARAAVLADLSADQRAELHRHAARLIHVDGGRPVSVARHLVAAGASDEPWAPLLLQQSADSATATGQVDFALDCLRLARDIADDDQQRAAGRMALAEAEWKLDPERVTRHLGKLGEDVRRGLLRGTDAHTVLGYLLWHGRVDEASLALDRIAGDSQDTDAELAEARACLESCYPARREAWTNATFPDLAPTGLAADDLSSSAAMLAAIRTDRPFGTEGPRQGLRLVEQPLAPVCAALLGLSRPERLSAVPWCLPLLDLAATSGGLVWSGLLTAVRADLALLEGDLPGAAELAATALNEIHPGGWGVMIGAPLACLLTAAVELGRHEEAAHCLATPVPRALVETPIGLRYLRARGRYQLALNRPYAALSDFQSCGRLLRDWQLDGPDALPWWIDVAQALLRLNRHEEARRLLTERLTGLRDGDERTRGRALRQLAATADPATRPALLIRSVTALQAANDRLELAYALADLGGAYNAGGDSRRGRLALRRAWQVANVCQVRGLSETLLPSLAASPPARPPDGADTRLSAAEHRVGTLAARGLTNRQIAGRLNITVSTVEQHLTKVYRKLNVRSRIDLPVYLQTGSPPAEVGLVHRPPFGADHHAARR